MKRKREGNTKLGTPRCELVGLLSTTRGKCRSAAQRRIAATTALDVQHVMEAYRPPRFRSLTDRTNLPEMRDPTGTGGPDMTVVTQIRTADGRPGSAGRRQASHVRRLQLPNGLRHDLST